MITFLQSVCAMLIGVVMSVFGAIHALSHYPGMAGFDALWASMPALGAVAWFLLGIAALIAGVALFAWSVRGFRRRLRQVQAALDGPRMLRDPHDPRDPSDLDDEPGWVHGHPYH